MSTANFSVELQAAAVTRVSCETVNRAAGCDLWVFKIEY
jgi:hypothetical protein